MERIGRQWRFAAVAVALLGGCGGSVEVPGKQDASAGTSGDEGAGTSPSSGGTSTGSTTGGSGGSVGTGTTADVGTSGSGGASSGPTSGGSSTTGTPMDASGGQDAGNDAATADAATDSSEPEAATEPDAAADADPVDPGPAITCPTSALEPGDRTATLMHDGLRREFSIHVPAGYDNSAPVPLVLNFHGATSNMDQQRMLFSKMDETSDAEGFIVVYPQGTGASWNAGACCRSAASDDVDDVGFARALVAYMSEQACIDPKRVYATGFSNGGRLSYRLGCEAADLFAAIAPVAGTKSFPDLNNSPGCMPSRPLSLIDFMGSEDSRIAAQPGQVAEWVAFNGCTDAAPQEVYRQGAHYCMAYTECEAGTSVTYCVADGTGHCWPGSSTCPLGDTTTPSEMSANALMWEVFERSSL